MTNGNSASNKVDALTLRLATIRGAVCAASCIVIQHAEADDELQHASDILDLAEQDIERLRMEICAGDSEQQCRAPSIAAPG